MKVLTLDFESHGIENRPSYPPAPVGIAYYDWDKELDYLSFGHPQQNVTNERTARNFTNAKIKQADLLLFHNAAFDCAILEEKWDIEVPWDKVVCTMVMAFLHNPHGELSLKPLAGKHLNMPPEERDKVREWLVANNICRASDKNWGKYIALAPGNIVGPYAMGDVIRTYKLWEFFNASPA